MREFCPMPAPNLPSMDILGYQMYCNDQQFRGGDGIVTKGVDNTIANIGILARQGMQQTDKVILEIMTSRCS